MTKKTNEVEINSTTFKMIFKLKWYHHILYFPQRAWFLIVDYCKEVYRFYQRGVRGYGDRDLWNFDYYLANIISKGLQQFKRDSFTYPSDFKDEIEWENAIVDVIYTFQVEKMQMEGQCLIPKNNKERKQFNKVKGDFKILSEQEVAIYNRGWNLFRKYFAHFND